VLPVPPLAAALPAPSPSSPSRPAAICAAALAPTSVPGMPPPSRAWGWPTPLSGSSLFSSRLKRRRILGLAGGPGASPTPRVVPLCSGRCTGNTPASAAALRPYTLQRLSIGATNLAAEAWRRGQYCVSWRGNGRSQRAGTLQAPCRNNLHAPSALGGKIQVLALRHLPRLPPLLLCL
jgi:hypothetical protein